MPGINLIYQHDPLDDSLPNDVDRLLETMKYAPQYDSESKLINRNLLLGGITYPGYPLTYSRTGPIHLVIEGFIYGESQRTIDRLIKQIAADPSDNAWNDSERLKQLLLAADGEFLVIVANDKTGDIHIFNDALGRITFYYYRDRDRFILAREPKFIVGMRSDLNLSRTSMAEAMLFLYPLGTRTMFEQIHKLPPASIISIKSEDRKIEISRVFEWNFSEGQVDADPGKYAAELIGPFLQSSRDRIEKFRDRTNILTLSGGLDSRTVLAGLKKYEIALNLITFVDERGDLLRDLSVARELAAAYGLETRHIDLPGINIEDMNRLITMKDGHGTGGIMGTVMKSLDILLAEFGHGCAFYTGDGGGLILAPRCQKLRLDNIDDLTARLLRRNSFFTIDEASSIMRIDSANLKTKIREHFASYPETSLRDKYGHFSIFEHLFRQSFEGEDRVRFFFWCNTTFYSMPYFSRAMQLSDKSKDNHRLFVEFHKQLDPRIARIKYANWGFPISSPFTPAYLFLKNWTIDKPRVEKAVRRAISIKRALARHGKIESVDEDALRLKENIKDVIAKNPGLDNYIDTKRIVQLLPGWHNHLQLYSLTSIVTYIGNLLRAGVKPGIED
jgi:asparagine synthase (glutamine-hydrolysing)